MKYYVVKKAILASHTQGLKPRVKKCNHYGKCSIVWFRDTCTDIFFRCTSQHGALANKIHKMDTKIISIVQHHKRQNIFTNHQASNWRPVQLLYALKKKQ